MELDLRGLVWSGLVPSGQEHDTRSCYISLQLPWMFQQHSSIANFENRYRMGRSRNSIFLLCVYLLLAISSQSTLTAAQTSRMVFAHYLLYYPDSIDVYKQEIALAQSVGIQAFALNFNVLDASHQTQVDLMFQAASESPGGFKLFFSADMHEDSNGKLSVADLLTLLSSKYTSHPNQMKYGPNSKPLFTAWLGGEDSDWTSRGYTSAVAGWTDVFSQAGGKANYYFVPFFSNAGNYYGLLGDFFSHFGSLVDGYYAWDTSAWNYINGDYQNPYDSRDNNNPGDKNAIAASHDSGKIFMASVSPWFFKDYGTDCSQTANHAIYGNYAGPNLWLTRWQQVINDGPDLVEIVSWNDWIEGHYTAPPLSGGAAASHVNVQGFPHQAYLELGKHYIEWYKSGTEPAVSTNTAYLFYYTQPEGAAVSNPSACTILHSENLTDKLYATVLLTQPGTVVLNSGSATSGTLQAPAGVSTFSINFSLGTQSVTLTVNGVVTTVTGAQQISNTNLQSHNFLVYSTCNNNC